MPLTCHGAPVPLPAPAVASGRRATARAAASAATARARRSSAASAWWSCAGLFGGVFWLTWQLLDYAELGDYLIRLGLSWLFLTFLSFLAFSGVVTALSHLLPVRGPAPAAGRARRRRGASSTRASRAPLAQAGWMVVAFLVPVLLASGSPAARRPVYYLTAALTVVAVRRDPGRRWARRSPSCSSTSSPPGARATS